MIKFFFFYESSPWFYRVLSALYPVPTAVHTSLTCLFPLFFFILPPIPFSPRLFYSTKLISFFSSARDPTSDKPVNSNP